MFWACAKNVTKSAYNATVRALQQIQIIQWNQDMFAFFLPFTFINQIIRSLGPFSKMITSWERPFYDKIFVGKLTKFENSVKNKIFTLQIISSIVKQNLCHQAKDLSLTDFFWWDVLFVYAVLSQMWKFLSMWSCFSYVSFNFSQALDLITWNL